VAGGFGPDAHGGADKDGAGDESPAEALAAAAIVTGFRQPMHDISER
jgi:hypothetical protein